MTFERRLVVKPEQYRGRTITARYMGPDLLAYVDEIELGGFYMTAEAAREAGRRYVDAEIDAEEKRARGDR